MKRLLITVAALAITSGSAVAQQQGDPNQGHRGQGSHGQGQGGQGGQSATGGSAGAAHANTSNNPAPNNAPQQGQTQSRGSQAAGRPDWNAYYKNNPDLQRDYKRNQQSSTYHESIDAYAQRHYQEHGQAEGRALPTLPGANQQQNQSRAGGWQGQGSDNRYQGQDRYRGAGQASGRYGSFQRNTTAQHRYRAGEYRWPRGFSYRRYSFGEFLPQIFFGQDFWLYDYGDYGLPYPPPGTAWVRYGPDALLIDRYSGEIVEVIYGVFY